MTSKIIIIPAGKKASFFTLHWN